MRCGRKYAIFFLALLLASSSLWAFPGRGEAVPETSPVTVAAVAMTEEPTAEAPAQNAGSGTVSEETSNGHNDSLKNSVKEAQKIVETSMVVGGKSELELVLDTIAEKTEAAEASSAEKDTEIADLREKLYDAEKEGGTKAYLMLDGIVGFEHAVPQFGVGLTVGTRLGNSLMLELGADYMIGGIDGYNKFSVDNFQFRCGVGWMF